MTRSRGAALRTSIGVLAAALLAAPAPASEDYAGDEACVTCHEDAMPAYAKTIHAKVFTEANARTPLMRRGCEACHGPGAAHVAEGGGQGAGGIQAFRAEGPEAIHEQNAVCLTCHAKGARLHWAGSSHESRDVACTSCHKVMENRSGRHQLAKGTELATCTSCHLVQKAKMARNAHMPVGEGAMSCSSCHNTHGSVNEALLLHDTVNENCYSCHAGKRGPFLWEHAPVSENCLNCHDPHGSNRSRMLTSSPPRLCQQCHVASLHPSIPREEDDHFVLSRSCSQCHVNIHGSNHPSGFAFTR